jgi:hypothetical protein
MNYALPTLKKSLKLNLYGKVGAQSQMAEGHRIVVARHNEMVHEYRHNLSRIIYCLKFCGHHEISFRGHDESEKSLNRGVFSDLVNEITKLDSCLNKEASKVSKYTSAAFQNELLDFIMIFIEKFFRRTLIKPCLYQYRLMRQQRFLIRHS